MCSASAHARAFIARTHDHSESILPMIGAVSRQLSFVGQARGSTRGEMHLNPHVSY